MTTELSDVEQSIARNKEIIAKGNALLRLQNNPDFRKVIGDGYLKEEAVRLVHLKGDQNMQKPERQASIQADIDAIGHFAQYLNSIHRFYELAVDALAQDEATLEELAAEELNK